MEKRRRQTTRKRKVRSLACCQSALSYSAFRRSIVRPFVTMTRTRIYFRPAGQWLLLVVMFLTLCCTFPVPTEAKRNKMIEFGEFRSVSSSSSGNGGSATKNDDNSSNKHREVFEASRQDLLRRSESIGE